MNKVEVIPIKAYGDEAEHVVRNMRNEDRRELWALSRSTPEQAVRSSIIYSSEAYVATNQGTPIAVFGAAIPAIGGIGCPWFMGTRGVDDCAKEYITMGRKFTAHLLEQCDILSNVALAENRKTLVFLRRMGFDIHDPVVLPSGVRAVAFEMRKRDV